ncbi:MAG TPA: cbb3-type cytochrome c oxidase subunit I [Gemmatimonadales bacterium]|nr:cbb3-type cytochrome c oxidase subunit I [Gemmatimonadales bacterium]
MSTSTPAAPLAAKRMAMVWAVTVLAILLVMMTLGLLMRMNQARDIAVQPGLFYAMMTLHGLGMAGTLFIGAVIAVWYRAFKYVRPNLGLFRWIYALVLVGSTGLIVATLIGGHASGWYMLYPLPFVSTWSAWGTLVAILSILVLGVAWLLAQLELLRAFAARYGARRLLGWDYLRGATPAEPLPAFVLIATVSLLSGAITTVVGAVVFLLYLFQWFVPTIHYDALLLKDLMFLFGHTIVNITMYLGVALVYERMPAYTGRTWGVNRVVAIAWNATLAFILLAFLHHLYMDHAQPKALQYLGQAASYLSAIPATVVTLFGAATQVYRADVKWRFAPLAYYLGLVGWTVGGVAAVLDSTIAVNVYLHNTLWVPGHFHTYFLVGFVLMLLAAMQEIVAPEAEGRAKAALLAFVAGGYGFVTMFYLGGLASVPRRYATYQMLPVPQVVATGRTLAGIAVWFVALVILGLLLYIAALLSGWRRSWAEA